MSKVNKNQLNTSKNQIQSNSFSSVNHGNSEFESNQVKEIRLDPSK